MDQRTVSVADSAFRASDVGHFFGCHGSFTFLDDPSTKYLHTPSINSSIDSYTNSSTKCPYASPSISDTSSSVFNPYSVISNTSTKCLHASSRFCTFASSFGLTSLHFSSFSTESRRLSSSSSSSLQQQFVLLSSQPASPKY